MGEIVRGKNSGQVPEAVHKAACRVGDDCDDGAGRLSVTGAPGPAWGASVSKPTRPPAVLVTTATKAPACRPCVGCIRVEEHKAAGRVCDNCTGMSKPWAIRVDRPHSLS